jgi:tripartite-type tricarboxylate transporter receptor subunit TctC
MLSHNQPMLSTVAVAAFTATAIALAAGSSPALAQSWPSQPIKFVIGYPPGGGADISGRLFAEHMAKGLSQAIVVENRSGAGGRIGATSVVRAEPNGYTLYVAAISEISIAPATVKDLAYDPNKDLKPVVIFTKTTQILVASPEFPPNNTQELAAYVKANPEKVSYSSFGTNTLNHINGERFKVALGIPDVRHVPYKGSGPSLTDIMGGHVQYTFDSPSTTFDLIQSGKLKAIGVAGPARLPAAPNIPTLTEAGLPNFYVSSWIGLLAPAGTPDAIIDRLNKEAHAVLKLPEVQEMLSKLVTEPGGGTPEEFASRIRQEIADFKQVAAKIGIVPQ